MEVPAARTVAGPPGYELKLLGRVGQQTRKRHQDSPPGGPAPRGGRRHLGL